MGLSLRRPFYSIPFHSIPFHSVLLQAWDYLFDDRARASLDDWLGCIPCRLGASNRQARMFSGLAPTGSFAPGEEAEHRTTRRDDDGGPAARRMLEAAMANLEVS